MSVQYYILQNGVKTGPYDLVALIRKIRNGSLTPETMMQLEDDSPPKAASEWPALAEFFADKLNEKLEPAAAHSHPEILGPSRRLGEVLQDGWEFLQRNQISTVFSGFMVLAIIIFIGVVHMILPESIRTGGYMLSFIFSYFLLTCYMLILLRLTRSQPIDLQYIVQKVLPAIKPLLLSSIFVCLPCIVGMLLVLHGLSSGDPVANGTAVLPKLNVWELNTGNINTGANPIILSVVGLVIFIFGIYVMSLYIFTPLLILEHGKSIWEGMEVSRATVLKSGIENIGIYFALFVLNFIAGLCALLPLALTLPVTMGPVAIIFDEEFS